MNVTSNVVSVIIPCYNGEKFISRAIASVYAQEYDAIELIVINDGSTDCSEQKVLCWKEKFDRKGWSLKYISQENFGPAAAVNTGLKYVTGVYLTLIDADDCYLPGSIAKKAKLLDEHPEYVMVRSNGWVVCGERRWLFVQDGEEKTRENIFNDLLVGRTNNWAGSYMVRTQNLFGFYPDRNIYPSRFGQNLQILLPLAYHQKAGFLDEPLMEYLRQPSSLSKGDKAKDLKNAEGYRDIRKQVLKTIVKNNVEYQRYDRLIEKGYWNTILNLGCVHRDRQLIRRAYSNLGELGERTLQNRITYYQAVMPPIAFVLRVLRKYKLIQEKHDFAEDERYGEP